MNELREPLFDRINTAKKIKDIIFHYADDLKNIYVDNVPLSDFTLEKFFDYVKNIKYRRDTKPIEVISRPYYIIKHKNLGMDCKKKTILLSCFFSLNNIPYRLIGSSRRIDKKVHHIFPQIKIYGQWKNADATYSDYDLFEPKEVTYSEVL